MLSLLEEFNVLFYQVELLLEIKVTVGSGYRVYERPRREHARGFELLTCIFTGDSKTASRTFRPMFKKANLRFQTKMYRVVQAKRACTPRLNTFILESMHRSECLAEYARTWAYTHIARSLVLEA